MWTLLVGTDLLIQRARDSLAYSCFFETGLAVGVAMTSPYLTLTHLTTGMTALPVSYIIAALYRHYYHAPQAADPDLSLLVLQIAQLLFTMGMGYGLMVCYCAAKRLETVSRWKKATERPSIAVVEAVLRNAEIRDEMYGVYIPSRAVVHRYIANGYQGIQPSTSTRIDHQDKERVDHEDESQGVVDTVDSGIALNKENEQELKILKWEKTLHVAVKRALEKAKQGTVTSVSSSTKRRSKASVRGVRSLQQQNPPALPLPLTLTLTLWEREFYCSAAVRFVPTEALTDARLKMGGLGFNDLNNLRSDDLSVALSPAPSLSTSDTASLASSDGERADVASRESTYMQDSAAPPDSTAGPAKGPSAADYDSDAYDTPSDLFDTPSDLSDLENDDEDQEENDDEDQEENEDEDPEENEEEDD